MEQPGPRPGLSGTGLRPGQKINIIRVRWWVWHEAGILPDAVVTAGLGLIGASDLGWAN